MSNKKNIIAAILISFILGFAFLFKESLLGGYKFECSDSDFYKYVRWTGDYLNINKNKLIINIQTDKIRKMEIYHLNYVLKKYYNSRMGAVRNYTTFDTVLFFRNLNIKKGYYFFDIKKEEYGENDLIIVVNDSLVERTGCFKFRAWYKYEIFLTFLDIYPKSSKKNIRVRYKAWNGSRCDESE